MRPGPRALTVLGILLTLCCLLASPRPAQAGGGTEVAPLALPADEPAPPLSPAPDPAQRLLELINRVRWERARLPPLKANRALAQAAQSHSQDMAEEHFFGHTGSDFSSPWDRIDAASYGNWYVLAENIAAGYESPQEVVQAWMESPRHRENLLNGEICEAGIGYVDLPGDTYPGTIWGYQYYWTLDIGSRWDTYPLVIAGEAYSTTTPLVSIYYYGQGWATEMRLSNDGETWSDWQPYQPMLTWELPTGSGIKRVYGQLRDAQGNLMESDDEIVLQEKPAPPEEPIPFVSPAQAVFIVQEGSSSGQPQQYALRIRDPGAGSHFWYAHRDQDWLHLSVVAGLAPSDVTLTLAADPTSLLAPGIYTATLSIEGIGAQAEVQVQLIVLARVYSFYLPQISLNPRP